jgi:TRAP-type C4-dicarboxylate transport system substrate-binding protein
VADFDTWVGCAVRWTLTVFAISALIGLVSDFAWKRVSIATRLAIMAVWRRGSIRQERERKERERREREEIQRAYPGGEIIEDEQ